GADNLMGMPLPTADYNDVTVMDIQREHADNIIHHVIEKYGKGLEITHFNEFGSTADGILNCSEEFKADLIVIGTHSRTGIDRLLMGSVAEKVIRNAKIPVMVVPLGEKD
ncbi:universal stress protein, partial [Mucilaginibacter sp.]